MIRKQYLKICCSSATKKSERMMRKCDKNRALGAVVFRGKGKLLHMCNKNKVAMPMGMW